MSKADKMLLKCGFKQIQGISEFWHVYEEKQTGRTIDFNDQKQSMYTEYGVEFTPLLLKAVYTKAEELGWFNTYDAMDMVDEMLENDIDIETLTGMSWDEIYGKE